MRVVSKNCTVYRPIFGASKHNIKELLIIFFSFGLTMSVRVLSPEELEIQLCRLHNVLSSLPESLAYSSQHYFFENFAPDPDAVEYTGSIEEGVNKALENILAPKGRIDSIELRERGPGLVAVVNVLRKYTKDYPTNVVLQKWIFDLIEAGLKYGGSVRLIQKQLISDLYNSHCSKRSSLMMLSCPN